MPRNKSSTLGREGIVDDTRREFMPGVVENRQEKRVSEIFRDEVKKQLKPLSILEATSLF